MDQQFSTIKKAIDSERESILEQLQSWLETPMIVLAFIWLMLFVVEVLRGLGPLLTITGYVIWGVFLFEFALGLVLAVDKLKYLKVNWLKGLALVAPPIRIVRVIGLMRLASAAGMLRGLRLLRILSSTSRGMRALGATMNRRGFGYVFALTLIVIVAGSAGIYAFEYTTPAGRGITSYGTALWFTAMMVTTMGSDIWPLTPEGRLLCFLLALYSFAMFGYVTATLATFFIGRDAEDDQAEVAGDKSLAALRAEIAALREEIAALKNK